MRSSARVKVPFCVWLSAEVFSCGPNVCPHEPTTRPRTLTVKKEFILAHRGSSWEGECGPASPVYVNPNHVVALSGCGSSGGEVPLRRVRPALFWFTLGLYGASGVALIGAGFHAIWSGALPGH